MEKPLRMGNGLLIFARADDGADQLFHGALLSTVNYLLIVISVEERSVMEQLSTSGSAGTVTAIITTPLAVAPARCRCAPAPNIAHGSPLASSSSTDPASPRSGSR